MTETRTLNVPDMSCGHCEASVRREVAKLDGVEDITVSAATGKLLVTTAAPLADADVIAAVDEAGYEAARVR